jgi:hypothetical protein
VPLLLLATGSSFVGHVQWFARRRQRLTQVGGQWGLERPGKGALGDGPLDAGRVMADVGAPAGEPARGIDLDGALGRPDDPPELALGTRRAARDA